MASDTNTKTLLKKVVGGVSDFSEQRRIALKKYSNAPSRRKYHPARLISLIVGVNLIPVLLLILALLFLGEYRSSLIRSELELTKTQTDLAALALREDNYETVLGEFKLNKNMRIAIFNADNNLVSSTISFDDMQLPSDRSGLINRALGRFLSVFFDLFQVEYNLPTLPDINTEDFSTVPGLDNAQNGQGSLSVWNTRKNQLFFTSSVPLQNKTDQFNAIFTVKPAIEINNVFNDLRNDIFRAFLIIIFISAGISLFLVQSIATPLRRLATAAESIRHGSTSLSDIPDMSGRGDEIGELSIALRSLVQALWERMDNIENFAADVSHELKNPITSMQSALETMANVKSAKDRKKLLGIMAQDVRRLDKLITDISQATRLDVALSREETRQVDMRRLLTTIQEAYLARLENLNLTQDIILSDNCTGSCQVIGNIDRLTQVFTNLLDNALSFAPEKSDVSIILNERPTTLEISIKDEGIGIPEGKEDKIFERFYSERPENEFYGEHSGLGLSICKQIIHAHSGIIEVRNDTENQGAIFTVILPKA